jgi:PIN domain nuclease of toxin-antitoxin system
VQGDARVNDALRSAIESQANEKLVSMASIWELAIKERLDKLQLGESLDVFLRRELGGFQLLAISFDHALKTATLPLHHRDPFDRMLAAQAIHENLTIVSADEVFNRYGVERLWQPPSDP